MTNMTNLNVQMFAIFMIKLHHNQCCFRHVNYRYPNNVECLARKRDVSIFRSMVKGKYPPLEGHMVLSPVLVFIALLIAYQSENLLTRTMWFLAQWNVFMKTNGQLL